TPGPEPQRKEVVAFARFVLRILRQDTGAKAWTCTQVEPDHHTDQRGKYENEHCTPNACITLPDVPYAECAEQCPENSEWRACNSGCDRRVKTKGHLPVGPLKEIAELQPQWCTARP